MKKIFFLLALMLCVTFSPGSAWGAEPPVNVRDIAQLKTILRESEAEIKAAPGDVEANKCAGIAAHQLALFDGKGYAGKALKYLEVVHKAAPDDIIIQAYYGSAHALVGRDGTAVVSRVSNVNKGVSILNRAVKKAPEDFIVRMVRASVFFELPPMFDKAEVAYEDFLFVEESFPRVEEYINDDLKAEVYYKLGFLAGSLGRKDQKNHYFAKAVETAPDSQWAKLARKG